jgi:hypothetical protein
MYCKPDRAENANTGSVGGPAAYASRLRNQRLGPAQRKVSEIGHNGRATSLIACAKNVPCGAGKKVFGRKSRRCNDLGNDLFFSVLGSVDLTVSLDIFGAQWG